MSITLSLNEISVHNPCAEGWNKALKALGKTLADDTCVTFAWIIKNNGLDDALWALRCLPDSEQWRVQLFARWCALSVIHLWDAPKVVKDYLTSGDESLRAAARAAARAARAAARDAMAAAWDAARAARAAAMAAWDAARAALAAIDAARAAWDAARAAAWAARAAAWAAALAASDAQKAKLIEIMELDHVVTTLVIPEMKE